MKYKVSEIKSYLGFAIKIKGSKLLYLFSRIKVYASSGNSVTYGLFTIVETENDN